MQITIHRGTREIGGSCIQLNAGDHSILLDAGSPLAETSSPVDLDRLDFNAVLISHPHSDHYGMIASLDATTPVYIGRLAGEMVNIPARFTSKRRFLVNDFRGYENRQPFSIGPFRITPYLMDHSSVDAYGFLVEAEGKRVYYSGDFRSHGIRDQISNWFKADHPTDVDVLLMEGTMMGRDNLSYPDEKAVKHGMIEVLERTDGPCFLVSSGQNIDRLCMAYAACLQAQRKRTFVTDLYTGFILFRVSQRFPKVPSILTKPDVKVLTDGVTARAHRDAFDRHPDYFAEYLECLKQDGRCVSFGSAVYGQHMLLKVSYFTDLLKIIRKRDLNAGVIYSQWSGYLQPQHDAKQALRYREVQELVGEANFHQIHTSGHADRKTLTEFAQMIKPKTLIPIHTENKREYVEQFKPINVNLLDDGECFVI